MTTTTAHYEVTGMTCEHCVAAVSAELEAIDGVKTVQVDLRPQLDSVVTVVSDRPLPVDAVEAAIDEAGYQLASSASTDAPTRRVDAPDDRQH